MHDDVTKPFGGVAKVGKYAGPSNSCDARPAMTSRARVQEMRKSSVVQDEVHNVLAPLTFSELSAAFVAHVGARPRVGADELERLANVLGRMAHELGRGA